MSRPARADLLVIGGGTAGLLAAQTAAAFGVRVVLVERDRTGGDRLWTGCIPSKSLIAAASAAAQIRRAHTLGIDAHDVTVDFPRVMRHAHSSCPNIRAKEWHNNWTTTRGSPQQGILLQSDPNPVGPARYHRGHPAT